MRVDRKIKQELEAEAKEKGVSPSEVVRTILAEDLRERPRRESCLDVARRIGLVGVYKDTPPDLSTNPDHFEGFGRA